ncbi:MAG: UDP-N-acetylmuramoyl-L-alanyl-D-glutamate--2,6-diaminopimelate ligase [Planctomycetes bacterium]|nr:UDP-N-acetylmuramoyl-L-alanyl-D-glutamate--2,6-diaminopimelate ligase [Planctomycetota bacterium]
MKLCELCQCLTGCKIHDYVENEVTGITHDSRKVKKGYLFVAIQGYKVDGHDFITDAMVNGAVAVVVEKKCEVAPHVPQIVVSDARRALACMSSLFYDNPSSKMTITGITGTNGKTTTSYFTKAIIEASGNEAGLIGTIQYQIGKRIIPARETTPESVEIQGYLSEMLKSGIKYAVIEASSHALSQRRLDAIQFRSAIFTNLSAEHLDYHEDVKSYRAEKLKLVKELDTDAFTILNADHNASKHFAESTKSQIIWYGVKKKTVDVTAESIGTSGDTTRFLLNSPWGKASIQLKLIGMHNVYNALAASANALTLGFKIDVVQRGLESLSKVPGRLERVDCGQDFLVYVDFAHTHHALQAVLSAISAAANGRIILVFGCGGNRDKKKRPKMGHIAEKYADVFWITNDNPRSEDPYEIIHEIQAGIKNGACFHVQPDRKRAIEEALLEAKSGDVVIIAGKGHEQYQISKDTVTPFDDRAVVRQILEENLVSHF